MTFVQIFLHRQQHPVEGRSFFKKTCSDRRGLGSFFSKWIFLKRRGLGSSYSTIIGECFERCSSRIRWLTYGRYERTGMVSSWYGALETLIRGVEIRFERENPWMENPITAMGTTFKNCFTNVKTENKDRPRCKSPPRSGRIRLFLQNCNEVWSKTASSYIQLTRSRGKALEEVKNGIKVSSGLGKSADLAYAFPTTWIGWYNPGTW